MSFVEMARKKWGDRANAEREKASAGAGVITALEQHLVREEDKTDLKNWQDKFQPQFQDSIVAELIELGLNPEYADRIEVRVSPVAKKPRPEDKPVLRYALGVFVASDNMDNASKNAITAFSKKLREIKVATCENTSFGAREFKDDNIWPPILTDANWPKKSGAHLRSLTETSDDWYTYHSYLAAHSLEDLVSGLNSVLTSDYHVVIEKGIKR